MSTKITIEITVADDQAYTAREAQILAAIQAHPSQGAAAVVTPAPAKAAAPVAAPAPAAKVEAPKAAPAPAKKAPIPTTSATSSKAAVLDKTIDEPAPAAEEAEEDLVGGEEEVAAYTLEDAVSAATKLVSEGKSATVKTALAAVGAKRVSELKGVAIASFMEAL